MALVQHLEPGTSFPDAIYRLNGGPSQMQPRDIPVYQPPPPPRLAKPREVDIEAGRRYLAERGIDEATILEAERVGFVRYMGGSVVFCGYDQAGKLRSATRRAIDPLDEVQKRDLKGTDKAFAPILQGDAERVWIVEGGADALALWSMYARANRKPPTVIVSGGSNVLSIFQNERVRAILEAAARVVKAAAKAVASVITITAEREKDQETQAKVDAARQKQAEAVAEIVGEKPRIWMPPEGSKDLADYHLRKLETERAQQQEKQRQREYNRDDYDLDRG